jgi:hypothetical protein
VELKRHLCKLLNLRAVASPFGKIAPIFMVINLSGKMNHKCIQIDGIKHYCRK